MSTKASLLQQIADLQKSVSAMGEPKKLQVFLEHHMPLDFNRSVTDLRMVDDIRHYMQRDLVHRLADELIRNGTVKFTETLEDDHRRFAKTVRIKAELIVC